MVMYVTGQITETFY